MLVLFHLDLIFQIWCPALGGLVLLGLHGVDFFVCSIFFFTLLNLGWRPQSQDLDLFGKFVFWDSSLWVEICSIYQKCFFNQKYFQILYRCICHLLIKQVRWSLTFFLIIIYCRTTFFKLRFFLQIFPLPDPHHLPSSPGPASSCSMCCHNAAPFTTERGSAASERPAPRSTKQSNYRAIYVFVRGFKWPLLPQGGHIGEVRRSVW